MIPLLPASHSPRCPAALPAPLSLSQAHKTYVSGSLSDGFYQLTIFGANVRLRSNNSAYDGNGDGIAGGDYVFGSQAADNFFALYGDTNGDGLVGVAEFGQFSIFLWQAITDVGYNPLFDYDGDGAIVSLTLVRFAVALASLH